MKRVSCISLILLLCAVAAACGSDNKVGSERLLQLQDSGSKGQPRLGESIKVPTQSPQAALGTSPKATQSVVAPKAAEVKFFDVTLVDYSPYYEPGASLQMPVGFTLRVTNKDKTEGRPVRSFEAADGSFGSPPLKAGGVWTQAFDVPGTWKIKDMAAGFILAELTVS
ncbi:MAG: hypothetical protein ABIS18_11535 [Actinomycetota bacterium]